LLVLEELKTKIINQKLKMKTNWIKLEPSN